MFESQARKSKAALFAMVAVVLLAITCAQAPSAHAAEGALEAGSSQLSAAASGSNLAKAITRFDLKDPLVLEAKTIDGIKSQLKAAGGRASAGAPVIVHVPNGTYSVTDLVVPQNVILVAESGAKFVANAEKNSMINIGGSVYGGYYDGAKKAINVLYFEKYTFKGVNGITENATVTRAQKQGILAMGANCRDAQVIGCTVTNCGENGVCVLKDSKYKVIRDCMLKDNTWSGINISHSDVGEIRNCSIINNGDKAVSTNSDPTHGYKQPGCAIGTIAGCTIMNNKTNGVYLKPKCTVENFTGNVLQNNNDGLVCSSKTERGTTGASYAKNVTNNKFKGNKNSNICAAWKGATIYVGNNNVVEKGKDAIYGKNGGTIKITGSKNVIKNATNAGINVSDGSSLVITGKNNKIQANGSQGIYLRGGKATISGAGTQILKNKKMGIAMYAKSTFNINGSSTKIAQNKLTAIYLIEKSKLTVSGKKTSILDATDMGIVAKRSTVSITGAQCVIKNSKKAGIGLYDKAKLTMSGKKGEICKSGTYGIYAVGKSTAMVKGIKFNGNTKGSHYTKGGAKVTIK